MIADMYAPLMVETAKEAGALAMKYFKVAAGLEVRFKGQADLLCEADNEVEKLIQRRLFAAYPEIAFWGEETGRHGPADAEMTWVVDPIDGTTNFLSGLPFAISIGLVKGEHPIAGIIFAPVSGEIFCAVEGHGATLNNKQIQVRLETDPKRFVVGTGLPLDHHRYSHGAYDRLHALREGVSAIRIVGTCALSLAFVACGRLDGYFEGPTGFLDCAAGIVLVREAGGIVTDFWGKNGFVQNVTFTTGAPDCQRFILETTHLAELT